MLGAFQALYGLWCADPKHLATAVVVPFAAAPTAASLVRRRREPNASSHDGSPAANEVVARLFCRRGRFGTYELFARCR